MYVDSTYYSTTYIGAPVPSGAFEQYERRAEAVINQATYHRIGSLSELPTAYQGMIKDAVCAQIEYYVFNGLDVSLAGASTGDYSIGRIRVGGGSAVVGKSSMVCPAARVLLDATGLTYAGVVTT